MIVDTRKLRIAILSNYKSINKFNIASGLKGRYKSYDIINGKHIPDIEECAKIAETLDLNAKDFIDIFMPILSPYGDKKINS